MIVGPANSGKSTIYKTLSDILTMMSMISNGKEEKEVETYVINPKSITKAQMYGKYDKIS